jgi:hypothetical protein
MRLRSRLKWFVSFAVLAYAASPAGAQTSPPPPPQGVDAHVGFQARVGVTPEQQVAEGAGVLTYISQASQVVGRRLAAARQQKDVVKMLCLNDKLSQIDVAGRSAGDRDHSLQAAAGRHDVELANHEYTIVGVLRQRVEQLMTEANQCIGEEASFTGGTTTFTTVDPNLPPPGDETALPPVIVGNPAPPVEVPPPSPNSPAK